MSFFGKKQKRVWGVLSLALGTVGLVLGVGNGAAQQLKQIQPQNQREHADAIVVGKLSGHDDYRKLRIRIGNRWYPVRPGQDARPFEVTTFTPERVEVTLHRLPLTDQTDPARIFFRFFENERQLITAMILEQVDYAVFRTRQQASEVNRANPFLVVIPLRTQSNTVQMVVYNLSHPLLGSPIIRRALSFGMNKEKMVEELLLRDGIVAHGGPYEPDRPFSARGLDAYEYNPKKAMNLLRQQGWRDVDGDGVLEKNGQELKFRLAFEKGVELSERLARRIKLDLFELGIEIIPVPYTRIEMSERLGDGQFEAALVERRFEENLEDLYRFFADRRAGYVHFRNRNFDTIFRQGRRLAGSRGAESFAHQMQAIINRYALASFLFYRYYDYHLFNIKRVDNFYDERAARVRPFDQWSIRQNFQRR